jgi:hypothetical protein
LGDILRIHLATPVAAFLLAISLAGCTSGGGEETTPVAQESTTTEAQAAPELTAACASAFSAAEADLRAMYAKALEDDEAEFTAAIAPLFIACESPADLYAGGMEYPYVYGLTDAAYLDKVTLQIYCGGQEATAACTGMDTFKP